MRTYYIDKTAVTLRPSKLIGEGGEAEIFQLDSKSVLKLFKAPDHPNFKIPGDRGKALQDAARHRLSECQVKLPLFPRAVTPRLVEPSEFVYDRVDRLRKIVGYTMPLIKPGHSLRDYAQRGFRESSGFGLDVVIDIFFDLHDTLMRLHDANVIIGDFNQFNVLIVDRQAFLIDADSMQFAGFDCTAYSPRYADPLILGKNKSGEIVKVASHSKDTDWYAFSILLLECLLYVHPYGGVYKPAVSSKRISADERPLQRISILHPDVMYPAMGVPFHALPLDVQWFFEDLLTHDRRGMFPNHLLLSLHPTNQMLVTSSTIAVSNLQASAGSNVLTNLHSNQPLNELSNAQTNAQSHVLSIPQSNKLLNAFSNGLNLTGYLSGNKPPNGSSNNASQSSRPLWTGDKPAAQEIFSTRGVILKVDYDGNSLRYLYHEDGKFIREDGRIVFNGSLDPSLKFALNGSSTVCGKGARSFVFTEDQQVLPLHMELFRGQEPIFAANSRSYFFVENGQLFRSSPSGAKLVDEVFSEQTRIWAGSDFGFGFFIAGEFRRAFLFDADVAGRTIIDTSALAGNLKTVDCRFSEQQMWLIASIEKNGQILNRVAAITRSGKTSAILEDFEGNSYWLDDANSSSCAASFPLKSGGSIEALLVATTSGVVQIESIGGQLQETKLFAGTEDFVQPGDHLLFSQSGLYAWNSKWIRLITTSYDHAQNR